jgi:hypothetical protein
MSSTAADPARAEMILLIHGIFVLSWASEHSTRAV